MGIAIVKYNAGNIQSVLYALERLGAEAEVTDDHVKLKAADKVIFPGVGEASSAMKYLRERGLDQVIKDLTQPVLGICVGMQLLCEHSEEGDAECIGIFRSKVKKFQPGLKIPQIGWNQLQEARAPLFKNIAPESYCYFVHSYYAELSQDTASITEYGIRFSSALQRDNFYGVQFHAEKSAEVGEKVIKNFLEL